MRRGLHMKWCWSLGLTPCHGPAALAKVRSSSWALGRAEKFSILIFQHQPSGWRLGWAAWKTREWSLQTKKCEIFISKVMVAIGGGTWRNSSFICPDKSGAQLTFQLMGSAQIQCSKIQFLSLILSTGPIDSRGPLANLSLGRKSSPLPIPHRWTIFTTSSRRSFTISNTECDFRHLKTKLSDSAGGFNFPFSYNNKKWKESIEDGRFGINLD